MRKKVEYDWWSDQFIISRNTAKNLIYLLFFFSVICLIIGICWRDASPSNTILATAFLIMKLIEASLLIAFVILIGLPTVRTGGR
jgi:hypothetical protein